MKINVTLNLFFEIKGSEMFDYEIVYTESKFDLEAENLKTFELQKYADDQRNLMAEMLSVPVENVRIIERGTYEDNTED